MGLNWVALTVFVLLFGFITWLGFAAAHWRRGDLDQLQEWGLGGRRFGTFITWFLLGGDIYTAYTFIAVPALAFGAGALAFFAVPYTIIIYPILFIVFPRLWYVCRKHGYVTAADFVRGRFGNRWLALAITITGIVATMPYIALQLVGLQVVIGASPARVSSEIFRSSSPSSSWRPSRIRADCGRRRRSPSSKIC
jgi:SSS family solute:Na+ symporter